MGFFELFSSILAIALLLAAFFSNRIGDRGEYRTALAYLFWALILYYPVSGIFFVGVYLSFVAQPVGFVLAVLSLRSLCLALLAQSKPD